MLADESRLVLVVEDNAITRNMMCIALQGEGYTVLDAADGRSALEHLGCASPALVIQDLRLPDMDGFDLVRRIRTLPNGVDIPILAVSGFIPAPEGDRASAASEFAEILVKPIEPSRLLRTIATLLRSREQRVSPTDGLVRQGRREAVASAALLEGKAVSSALLSFLTRFSEMTLEGTDAEQCIDELLAGYLDASGASLGAAYLGDADGGLTLRARLGFADSVVGDLATFFGHGELLQSAIAGRDVVDLSSAQFPSEVVATILERTGAKSILLVPLPVGRDCVGLLLLASRSRTLPASGLHIAEAVRGPIAQAIALSRTVAQLVASHKALRGITDSMSDAILATDEGGRITFANRAVAELSGYSPSELVGKGIHELLPFVTTRGPPLGGGAAIHKDGRPVLVAVSPGSFVDARGRQQRSYVVRDLSLREKLDELADLASKDVLTELYNRRRFEEHLAGRFVESNRYGTTGALLLLDLDGFKPINDTFGHAAGDAVLRAVGAVLKGHTRTSDFAARLGGDEFVIELPRIALDNAVRVANTLMGLLRQPLDWEGESLHVCASMGIALYPKDGQTPEDLVKAADDALYRAKRTGRDRICVFESSVM